MRRRSSRRWRRRSLRRRRHKELRECVIVVGNGEEIHTWWQGSTFVLALTARATLTSLNRRSRTKRRGRAEGLRARTPRTGSRCALAARWQTTPKTALRRLGSSRRDERGRCSSRSERDDGASASRRSRRSTASRDLLSEEPRCAGDDVESLKEWKLRAHAEIQRLRARVAQLEREKGERRGDTVDARGAGMESSLYRRGRRRANTTFAIVRDLHHGCEQPQGVRQIDVVRATRPSTLIASGTPRRRRSLSGVTTRAIQKWRAAVDTKRRAPRGVPPRSSQEGRRWVKASAASSASFQRAIGLRRRRPTSTSSRASSRRSAAST